MREGVKACGGGAAVQPARYWSFIHSLPCRVLALVDLYSCTSEYLHPYDLADIYG